MGNNDKKSKKVLFVLIDGVGDVNIPSLGKTPLQAASIPCLDTLAQNGLTGLLDPVEPGLGCGSDTAHLSLLGYDPRKYYRGRGAFESMGAGLDMIPGDIAFKSNFAYIDKESGIVISRRADRHFEGLGPTLCDALDGMKLPSFPHHMISVRYATEHRCGVRVRGPNLTDTITGTDPLKDNKKLVYCEPTINDESSIMTSKLINELSEEIYKILSCHPINADRIKAGKNPANCVLLRGCGSCLDVPSINELHGFNSFLIAPTCIIAGLGMTVGMDLIKVEGATGDYFTNLQSKAKASIELLQGEDYDFGFCHIKAVDDAGHDRSIDKKIHFLEEIDKMMATIVTAFSKDTKNEYTIVVTGDHSTPVLYGDHSCEPVPFFITKISSTSNKEGDDVSTFDEVACSKGALGRFCGDQIMILIKAFMNE